MSYDEVVAFTKEAQKSGVKDLSKSMWKGGFNK